MDTLTFSAMLVALGITSYKTDLLGRAVDLVTRAGERAQGAIFDESGRWGNLVAELPLREISAEADLIEMSDGWFYTGIELRPVSTDGLNDDELELLTQKFNRALYAMPADTRIQTLTHISEDMSEVCGVFERKAAAADSEVWRCIEYARAREWKRQAYSHQVRTARTWVLIGRQVKGEKLKRIGVKGFLTNQPWRDASLREIAAVHEELMMLREGLLRNLWAAGGDCQELDLGAVWSELWRRLNPVLAERMTAPAYVCGAGEPNPRQLLVATDLHTRGWMLRFGDATEGRLTATVRCQRLPLETNPLVMQKLLRELPFPAVASSHAHLMDVRAKQEELEARQRNLKKSLQHREGAGSRAEGQQAEELETLLQQLQKNVNRVARVGWGVTFEAGSEAELRRRRQVVYDLLRDCNEMAGVTDSAVPLRPHLATMPGCADLDRRTWEVPTRVAVNLMGWTGGAHGVSLEDALHVFEQADGRPYGWNPHPPGSASNGMMIVHGDPGSGKSGFLNLLATVLRSSGYQGLTFDYNGSATRVVRADGGQVVRLGDSSCPRGLGLMSILPQEDEEWSEEELTETQVPLPKERLAQLVNNLAELVTDYERGEKSISLQERDILQQAVLTTYERSLGQAQPVEELIWTLRHWRKVGKSTEREHAENLARKLSVYMREGAYGRFLNDCSPPLPVGVGHTVFDFYGTTADPVLSTITSIVAGQFVARFLRVKRNVPKFFTMDEGRELTEQPRPRRIANYTFRTARKCGVRVATFATQVARGLPDMEDIYEDCSVRWMFRSAAPEVAADVFHLPAGARALLVGMGGGDSGHRPCLLQSGRREFAMLRLAHNDLDKRLLLGAAATDVVTMEQARRAAGGMLPARLERALAADALGTDERQFLAADD